VRGFGKLARVSGVTVYVHWSLAVLGAVVLMLNADYLASTVFLIACVLGVFLLHEWGHVLAAQRLGYRAWSIELYPFVGLTRFEAPRSLYDAAFVAWGGVLAQFAVAAPLLLWLAVFGLSSIGPLNGILAIFGPLSCAWAVFNLLPIPRLDGATAWRIVPFLWRRLRRGWNASVEIRPRQSGSSVEKGPWLH